MEQPRDPFLYHLTHIDNLPSILADGGLWSDAEMASRGAGHAVVGLRNIKDRRLTKRIGGHEGLTVGQCVPFYFCSRSVMLFLLHRGNQVPYDGGQEPLLHLVTRVGKVVEWARCSGKRWAFSLTNAAASYAAFRTDLGDLAQVHWDAVGTNDWRDPVVKDGKQAEFLVEQFVPFDLIGCIGARSEDVRRRAEACLTDYARRLPVVVKPNWYY